MIDIKEIQVLNTKKCKCGYEFSLKDFIKLDKLTDTHGFYANIVKHYTMAKCPNCKNETILLLKQKGQTWEVMNTARFIKDEKIEPVKQVRIENKEKIKSNQEFICPVCQKVCKNKVGLNAHMKTHSK